MKQLSWGFLTAARTFPILPDIFAVRKLIQKSEFSENMAISVSWLLENVFFPIFAKISRKLANFIVGSPSEEIVAKKAEVQDEKAEIPQKTKVANYGQV